MAVFPRLFLPALACATLAAARAAPPAELAAALDFLRAQKSYSWEVINGDPGPIARRLETPRGTITTVQQSRLPNIKGQIDRNGDTLLRRDWPDGVRLDTIILQDGTSVTRTPEGWMTEKEILTAQAEENIRSQTPSPRFVWLQRADRPPVSPPAEELGQLLQFPARYEGGGTSYVARLGSNASGQSSDGKDGEPVVNVTITMNLRGGNIRDYELNIEGTRRTGRSRLAVPFSEQRIVIITYVALSHIDIPPEARDKLASARLPARPAR